MKLSNKIHKKISNKNYDTTITNYFLKKTMRTTLLLSLTICSLAALANDLPAERYALKESRTGSNVLRKSAWSTEIPLNRKYHELSPSQKASLHKQYEYIAPGDEPPFPAEGIGSIVEAALKVQQRVFFKGNLELLVNIDAEGNAQEVQILESPDPRLSKVIAGVMILTKYKPALCSGQACSMQYPFKFAFGSD